MNRHLIFGITGLLNLIAFLLHYQVFNKSKKARESWASCTIGAGFGTILYHAPEIIYGLETNIQPLWIGIFVVITGFALYLINRYDNRSLISM
ncbi:MAG: hypothetical protein WBB67_01795 [bacterium]